MSTMKRSPIRTRFGKLFLHLSLFFLLGHTVYCEQKEVQRPNIVFFILDDMTRDLFNCLPEGKGRNFTPSIDRLAGEGILLTNQYCSAPVCTPSRFSCLTGKYASRSVHKAFLRDTKKFGQSVVEFNTFITSRDATLPRYLREAGYTTGFVGKSHVVESEQWTLLPFTADAKDSSVKAALANNKAITQALVKDMGFDYAERIYYNNPEFNGAEELSVHNMDWITDGAVEFLSHTDERPFFLYFATTLPHFPSVAKRAWHADRRATPDGFIEQGPAVQPAAESIPRRLREAGVEVNDRNCNLLWLDDAVGVVLRTLEKVDKLDNTIIFFFNDNGQGAKGTLYQGGIHNPSIVWKKGGFRAGHESAVRVSNVDFAPTILELAGVALPAKTFDGKSFVKALEGSEEEVHNSLYFEMGFSRAVVKGKYKYLAIRYPEYALRWTLEEKAKMVKDINEKRRSRNQPLANPEADPSKPFSHLTLLPGGNYAEFSSTGVLPGYYDPDQLYDISGDPGEMKNLVLDPQFQFVLNEMKLELKKYIDTLPGGFPFEQPVSGKR